MRARRYLQQVCSGFVDYVADSTEEKKRTIDDMSIVHEYANMFPKDLTGVPLERQVSSI